MQVFAINVVHRLQAMYRSNLKRRHRLRHLLCKHHLRHLHRHLWHLHHRHNLICNSNNHHHINNNNIINNISIHHNSSIMDTNNRLNRDS